MYSSYVYSEVIIQQGLHTVAKKVVDGTHYLNSVGVARLQVPTVHLCLVK